MAALSGQLPPGSSSTERELIALFLPFPLPQHIPLRIFFCQAASRQCGLIFKLYLYEYYIIEGVKDKILHIVKTHTCLFRVCDFFFWYAIRKLVTYQDDSFQQPSTAIVIRGITQLLPCFGGQNENPPA